MALLHTVILTKSRLWGLLVIRVCSGNQTFASFALETNNSGPDCLARPVTYFSKSNCVCGSAKVTFAESGQYLTSSYCRILR
jgi:hypothetical protein